MQAFERRRKIIRTLYYRKSVTCETLAQELGVTVRTIYMDIDALTYSYPIETVRGRYGCVRLSDEYIRQHKVLRSDQAELVDRIRSQLKKRDLIIFDSIFSQFSLY